MKRLMLALSGLSLALWAGCAADGVEGSAPSLAADEVQMGGSYRGPGDSVPARPGLVPELLRREDSLDTLQGFSAGRLLEAQRARAAAEPDETILVDVEVEEVADAEDFDEIVVIERADGTTSDYGPGQYAALRAEVEGRSLPLPLERTDIRGDVTLNIASVQVTQAFHNPFGAKIEAVYVFPLPQSAAVSDFLMVLGERRIRGIVREREEAERIYQAARNQGYHASLLSQERPNVFTQKVANIQPGEKIDVEITYFQTLEWREGAFEMVVPTVVGPRFNPPGSTGGVGAVAEGEERSSGQTTEVTYLDPNRAGMHRLTLEVDVDCGAELAFASCDSHPTTVTKTESGRTHIALRDGEDVPNRDFVLRYAPAGDGFRGAVAVHDDPATGYRYFAALVQPPEVDVDAAPQPREMIFVVDCSGSMSGEPMAACKRTMRRCLERLRPTDTFQIIRFSDAASSMSRAPLAATPANVRTGLAYVDRLTTDGGTMMERGIRAALGQEAEAGRRRIVTFMTDGYIGNERDILRAVHENVGQARIFSFGVGSSTNRYLLERMADVGRGVAAYIPLDTDARAEIDALYARIERPTLADLRFDWHGAAVHDVEPRALPDLFAGRPLMIHGRVKGELPASITLEGKIGAKPYRFDLPIGAPIQHPALVKLWARSRIRSLSDAMAISPQPDEFRPQVMELALEHGLASAFTSFVAVDSSMVTEGSHGITVTVPAEMPRGVRYETTVKDSR
ncbi:MAG: VIT domain-containing protein [Planctomycetota bacterium]|nr:VIT domain-containing protein [Planctomycetota bacterium]